MNPFDLDNYYFDLPEELIAQEPLAIRTESKLLNYFEKTIKHQLFSDLENILKKPCLFIRNVTKVRNSRLLLKRKSGGACEVFILNPLVGSGLGAFQTGGLGGGLANAQGSSLSSNLGGGLWQALIKPAKRLKVGEILYTEDQNEVQIIEKGDFGKAIVKLPNTAQEEWLKQHGEVPLPPYIHKKLSDQDRYQTVYAKNLGASAAPTAGLHFTKEQITKLEALGHQFLDCTLHVGLGTFRTVDQADIRNYQIHKESIELSDFSAYKLLEAKEQSIPIIAVGTTSLRVIESVYLINRFKSGYKGETELFLKPDMQVKSADYLITNFHLPYSSLLILVQTFLGGPVWKDLYKEAILKKYRFFSFGDAMLLPNLS